MIFDASAGGRSRVNRLEGDYAAVAPLMRW